MIEPQSDDAVLLPDRGDADIEAVPLPDPGGIVAEAMPLPYPAKPVAPTDEEIEPPIVRHDPFAYMRNAPWMNRRLTPSGRAAAFLRRELEAFPAIEGRDPNGADLDGIVKRTVDYMVPIFKRERATGYAYDVLEEKRQARIAKARADVGAVDPSDVGIVKVSGGDAAPAEPGPALAQLGPEARNERIRSEQWRRPSDDGGYLESLEKYEGRKVRLPDGSLVLDQSSRTGLLMSPVEDLKEVARAGRAARQTGLMGALNTWRHGDVEPTIAAATQIYERTRTAIGRGGEFDYQRKAAIDGKGGFVQLRQFRNVSNFNVGLFMQQAGAPLELTLRIAGLYARENSSNHRPNEPYGLDPQTREFIELGHAAGKRGVFGW